MRTITLFLLVLGSVVAFRLLIWEWDHIAACERVHFAEKEPYLAEALSSCPDLPPKGPWYEELAISLGFGVFETESWHWFVTLATGECLTYRAVNKDTFLGRLNRAQSDLSYCGSGFFVRGRNSGAVFKDVVLTFLIVIALTVPLVLFRNWLRGSVLVVDSRSSVVLPSPVSLTTFKNNFNRYLKQFKRPLLESDNPHASLAEERRLFTRACAAALDACKISPVIDVDGVASRHSGDVHVICVQPGDAAHCTKTSNGLASMTFVESGREIKPYDTVPMMVDADWHYSQEELVYMFPKGAVILSKDFTHNHPEEVNSVGELGVVSSIRGGGSYCHGFHAWDPNGGMIVTRRGLCKYDVVKALPTGRIVIFLTPVSGVSTSVDGLRSYGIRRLLSDGDGLTSETVRSLTKGPDGSWALVFKDLKGTRQVIKFDPGFVRDLCRSVDSESLDCHANVILINSLLKKYEVDPVISVGDCIQLVCQASISREKPWVNTFSLRDVLARAVSSSWLKHAISVVPFDNALSELMSFSGARQVSQIPRATTLPPSGEAGNSIASVGGGPGESECDGKLGTPSVDQSSNGKVGHTQGSVKMAKVPRPDVRVRTSEGTSAHRRLGTNVVEKPNTDAKGKAPVKPSPKTSRLDQKTTSDRVLHKGGVRTKQSAKEHLSSSRSHPMEIGAPSTAFKQAVTGAAILHGGAEFAGETPVFGTFPQA